MDFNAIDIVAALILAYTIYKGAKNGLIIELSGLLAILIAAFASFKFSGSYAYLLNMDEQLGKIVAFILCFIVIIILIYVGSRLISKMIDSTSLSVLNKVFGAIIAFTKNLVVICLVLAAFFSLNNKVDWVSQSYLNSSIVCRMTPKITSMLFPYLDFATDYFKKL